MAETANMTSRIAELEGELSKCRQELSQSRVSAAIESVAQPAANSSADGGWDDFDLGDSPALVPQVDTPATTIAQRIAELEGQLALKDEERDNLVARVTQERDQRLQASEAKTKTLEVQLTELNRTMAETANMTSRIAELEGELSKC